MPNLFNLLGLFAISAIAVSAIATSLLFAWLNKAGKPLVTAAAPHGIVSFAFCWTARRSFEIVQSWRQCDSNHQSKIKTARQNLQLDFALMPAYVVLLCLLNAWLATVAVSARYEAIGKFFNTMSWLQFAAGGLDVVENLCLFRILRESEELDSSILSRSACICATAKFILMGIGAEMLLFVICAIVEACTANEQRCSTRS